MGMKRSCVQKVFLLAVLFMCMGMSRAGAAGEGNLILVNRENPLPENYEPIDLVMLETVIPDGLCGYEHEGIRGTREAAQAWVRLLCAAREDGLTRFCFSEGYRTWEEQQQLWDEAVESYRKSYDMTTERAEEAAAMTVALPGESEHHTGLAFDITVPGEYFGDTAEYSWMRRHCAEFGFIQRYTEEKYDETGYEEEEWHYRYVGVENALFMTENDLCLEEYFVLCAGQ